MKTLFNNVISPIGGVGGGSKETIKWIIQLLITILTAIATALGAASCVNAMM